LDKGFLSYENFADGAGFDQDVATVVTDRRNDCADKAGCCGDACDHGGDSDRHRILVMIAALGRLKVRSHENFQYIFGFES
jgi:hypothetical protein